MQNSKTVSASCMWVFVLAFAFALGLHELRLLRSPAQEVVIEEKVMEDYPSRLETTKPEQPPAMTENYPIPKSTPDLPELESAEELIGASRPRPRLITCSSRKADR